MEDNVLEKKSYYYLQQISASTSGDKKLSIIPFKGPKVTVGRNSQNAFVLPDITISRHQAVFIRTSENSWSVTNLSSSGMLLDGKVLPINEPQPLALNSHVQFSPSNDLYLYKFVCKQVTDSKHHRIVKNDFRNVPGGGTQGPAPSSAVPASQSLVQAHDQLEVRLRDSRAAYDQLLRDKISLAQSLERQELELQKKYEEEQLRLQQQMLDVQQQQEAQQAQEQLSQQLHDKVKELQEKLKSDRAELEQQMQLEKMRREELQLQQEAICQQLQQEKEVLQDALQQERLRLEKQVTEKVQEAEKQLQEQLQQVQSRLQHQEHVALDMSKELEKKAEAEERLQQLEAEKELLQKALEEARQDGQQVSNLQEALDRKETEKANLQQEMELMEFVVTAEAEKAVFDRVEEAMDSEMQCPICNELFIKAVLLNCSHTYCEYCIGCWKKKKRDCPSCRSPITSETRSLAIDNFIDKIVLSLSEQMKRNRAKTIEEREKEIARAAEEMEAARLAKEAAREARGRGRGRGRGGRGRGAPSAAASPRLRSPSPPPMFDLTSDSSEFPSEDEDELFGGDGTCIICGARDHFLIDCPFRDG